MRRIRFLDPAVQDITTLLAQSEEKFGSDAADAYRALLNAASLDLRTNPSRPTVRRREGTASEVRLYHLRHSRRPAGVGRRVGRPRHFIVFRDDGEYLDIVRVLHDAMDITARLGNED